MPTKLSRICDGIMEASWLTITIVLPLFFNIYSSRIFEPDKIALLRTLALLMTAAWAVKVIDQGGLRWDKVEWKGSLIKTVKHLPLMLPAIGLALTYIISNLFSVTPRVSFFGSYQRLQGTYTTLSYLAIFAVMIGNIRKREQVEHLVTTIILSSPPVSIYGVLQKFQLDPVPWGGDVTTRIASNMGNSIFVAGYLIMVVPLAIGRAIQVFTSLLKDTEKLLPNLTQATLYIIIIILDLMAIVMSGSRGPFLGLIVGIVFLIILLTIHWRVRWATVVLLGCIVVFGGFLLLLNTPNGPLENLRSTAWAGRFSHLFDTEQRTSQVRILIWQGASDLVSIHDPLAKPLGGQDIFNFLRPLVGYGPEGMYVAYNQFYPPGLGNVEKRNASPDRSHNETWDAIVTTGILGITVYLWLFGSLFYYGLKWLGLLVDQRNKILYWIFVILGGAAGVGIMGLWQGWEFFGIGLPFGMIFGMVVYVAYYSLLGHSPHYNQQIKSPNAVLLMSLLAAVVAHFIEINFGIAIAVTRTYFWVYTALMVLVGFILPKYDTATSDEKSDQLSVKKGKGKQDTQRNHRLPEWNYNAVLLNFPVVIMLTTLGYDFILNSKRLSSIGQILSTSFTRLSTHDNALSYGVLLLLIVTWLVGSILVNSTNTRSNNVKEWCQSIATTLGISASVAILFYVIHSGNLVRISLFIPSNQDELITQANNLGGLLTFYYIFMLFVIIGAAIVKSLVGSSKAKRTNVVWIVAPTAVVLVWTLAYLLNLRVVHADMTFKMAAPFAENGQWPIATLLYQRALSLAPNEDHYYLFLGRSYLEQAKTLENAEEQDKLVQRAEEDLKEAQRINPLNTDHTANLGRLYSWWAGRATSQAEHDRRGSIASDFYETATKLSPNNATIWGEWAVLSMNILGDNSGALEKLNHAISLDDQYNFIQSLVGDYYLRIARGESDPVARQAALDQAIQYYLAAIELSVGRDAALKPNYMISLGNAYIERANIDTEIVNIPYVNKAIDIFMLSLNEEVNDKDVWKIEETISKLYMQLEDRENALLHANRALETVPETQIERIQALIDLITTP